MSLRIFIQSKMANHKTINMQPLSFFPIARSSAIPSILPAFSRYAAIFIFGVAALFFAITSASKADSSHRTESIVTPAINSADLPVQSSAQIPNPFGTLDIEFPTEIVWTSSKTKTPSPGRKTLVVKGRDVKGPTQLIITQLDNNIAVKLWDGAGIQWEWLGNIASPVRLSKIFKGENKVCGGALDVPPEIQAQYSAGDNQGGIAGGGTCIDSETIDVMVAYSPCALQQFFYYSTFVPPFPNPPPEPPENCPDLQPPFDPDAALALLRVAVFAQEDAINESFDNSLISTPTHVRHIRIVAIVDTNQVPECLPGEFIPEPEDPGYTCHQPSFDPEAEPQKCEPLVPLWCGEDFEFGEDLDRISDPADPDYGGLLRQKRDYHRADLVVLLRVTGLQGIGGIARIKSVNEGCFESTGYCVVDVMGMGSMGHEIGHNLGCCHEPGQGGSFQCSMFPYSHGHRFTVPNPDGGSDVERGTIMAYPTGQGIPNFSNPQVSFQGEPTGTVQTQYPYWSDNARTIRETFDDVRCYRCADVGNPAPLFGEVECWGAGSPTSASGPTNYGQSIPPVDLTECSKIAAGSWHTLALQANGIVRAWGAGTTDTGQGTSGVNKGQSIVPTILTDPDHSGQTLGTCSDIAAGHEHSVAIRARAFDDPLDGTVIAWGSNDYGQRQVPNTLGACSQVAAGYFHTVALRRDGTVRCWGAGVSPIIGQYPQTGQSAVPGGLGYCSKIVAGALHTVVIRGFSLDTGGELAAWGAGIVSETNGGFNGFNWGQSILPYEFPTARYIDIAAGKYHTIAMKVDGTVKAWGAGITSGGPSPKFGQSIVPVGLGVCTKIAGGGFHSLAIKADTTLAAWGAGTTNTGTSPEYGQSIVLAGDDWLEISAGEYHSVAIQSNTSLLPCAGDFNNDRRRDGLDLTTLLSAWGTEDGDCNGDGTTDGSDMTLLLSGWGFCQ